MTVLYLEKIGAVGFSFLLIPSVEHHLRFNDESTASSRDNRTVIHPGLSLRAHFILSPAVSSEICAASSKTYNSLLQNNQLLLMVLFLLRRYYPDFSFRIKLFISSHINVLHTPIALLKAMLPLLLKVVSICYPQELQACMHSLSRTQNR